MLTHLRITNFALLDDLELDLGAGFNVLTGETGAGKSLLVEAVALLRGGRASPEGGGAGAGGRRGGGGSPAGGVRRGGGGARVGRLFEPPHGPAADALIERLGKAGID